MASSLHHNLSISLCYSSHSHRILNLLVLSLHCLVYFGHLDFVFWVLLLLVIFGVIRHRILFKFNGNLCLFFIGFLSCSRLLLCLLWMGLWSSFVLRRRLCPIGSIHEFILSSHWVTFVQYKICYCFLPNQPYSM